MAKSNIAAVESEAPYGYKADGTARKRPSREGPRNRKPTHVVFQVTDSAGNPITDVTLNILFTGKDIEKAYEVFEANPGSKKTKVSL